MRPAIEQLIGQAIRKVTGCPDITAGELSLKRELLDALRSAETPPTPLGVDSIRRRLSRGQYRTLPPETIEGDIAFLLRLSAAETPQEEKP